MPLKPSKKLGGFFVDNFYEKLIDPETSSG